MIRFKIITPERILYDGEVESVSLPTPLGEITILPNHIPLLASVTAGEIRCKIDNRLHFFAISGGFVEVKKPNQVNVLAQTAEFGHEIDLKKAEEAKDRARILMSSKDAQTHASAAASFQKHLARIKVARKHHSHSQQTLDSDNI